jgi:signal transduction histidine kinase
VRRVAALEVRLPVQVRDGPRLEVQADPDQLEQLLINLIRNAVDASLESPDGVEPEVVVLWEATDEVWRLRVLDRGPGIRETGNLFVPFYTTKPGGSGIGLALSRQIAEGHGGTLELRDRGDGPGAEAVIEIPLV